MKRSSLRWFGHIERMENEELVKVYRSNTDGPNKRGRPLTRWQDRVKEYVSERRVRGKGVEWEKRQLIDKKRWRSVWQGHPLGDASGGSKAS